MTEKAMGKRITLDLLTNRISSNLNQHVRNGAMSPARNQELQLVLEKIRLNKNKSHIQAVLS